MNNHGYVLVETLIVSVFIMSIFTLLYTNIFPLVGEYDRYKDYNTVEATYIAHWIRKFASSGLPSTVYTTAKTLGYADISDCSLYTLDNMDSWCYGYKVVNNITSMYLTPYSTTKFKEYVKNSTSFSRSFKEYISYLPSYANNTNKTPDTGYYRVIVEYENDGRKQYGTIELSNANMATAHSLTTSSITGESIQLSKFSAGATVKNTNGATVVALNSSAKRFSMPVLNVVEFMNNYI